MRDGYAGEDADEEFSVKGGCEGGGRETGGQILGLAPEDDGAGCLDGSHVFFFAVEDGDGDGVGEFGGEFFLETGGGFGGADAGYEVRGFLEPGVFILFF